MKNVFRFFKVKGVVAAIFLIFATLHATEINYYSVRAYNASPEAIQFLKSKMEKVYYDRYGVPTFVVKLENSNALSQFAGITVNSGITASGFNNFDFNKIVSSVYSWDFGVTIDLNTGWKHLTHQELTSIINLLVDPTIYSDPIVTKHDLTVGKPDEEKIYALRITGNSNPESAPAILFLGGIHGNEYISADVAVNLAWFLVDTYNKGTNQRIMNMIDNSVIWIIPLVNPYGHINNKRENSNNIDLNRNFDVVFDACVQRDHYIIDVSDFPDIFAEDYVPGETREINCGWKKFPGKDQDGEWMGSETPFTEYEPLAIRNFLETHRSNLRGAITYHSQSNQFIYGYGNYAAHPKDIGLFKPLAEKLAYITTTLDENREGYPYTPDGLDIYTGHHSLSFYPTTGDFCDYYMNYRFDEYDEQNPENLWPSYPAITAELLQNVKNINQCPVEDIERVVRANIASALFFIEYNIAAETLRPDGRWDLENFNPNLVNIDVNNDNCVDYFPEDCYSAKKRDRDGDGTIDEFDNCPDVPNPGQTDWDNDELGDLCDPCPMIPGAGTGKDSDGDGIDDGCDNCPLHPNGLEPINPFTEIISAPYGKKFEIVDPETNDKRADYKGLELYYEGGAFYSNGSIYLSFSDIRSDDYHYFFTEEQLESIENMQDISPDLTVFSPIYPANGVPVTYSTVIDMPAITGSPLSNISIPARSMLLWSFNYYWQPDHDLDGVGDVCDMPGEIVREGIPTINVAGELVLDTDNKAIITPQTGDGFAYSKIETVKSLSSKTLLAPWIGGYDDDSVRMKLQMPPYSGVGNEFCNTLAYTTPNNFTFYSSKCQAAVHVCAVNNGNINSWGEDGSCSTSDKTEKYDNNNRGLFVFGLSHGSDDFNYETIASWNMRISSADSRSGLKGMDFETASKENPNSDTFRKLRQTSTTGEEVYWNWRRDWWYINQCYVPENSDDSACLSLKTPTVQKDPQNSMYYAISNSIVPVTKAQAEAGTVPDYRSGVAAINDDYFFNSKSDRFSSGPNFWKKDASKYGRAHRYNMQPMELNYHGVIRSIPGVEIIPSIDISDFNIELCVDCWWRIPLSFIDAENLRSEIGRWFVKKDIFGELVFISEPVSIPENAAFFMSSPDSGEMFSVVEHSGQAIPTTYTIEMSPKDGGVDWHAIGTVSSFPETLSIKATAVHKGKIYIIGSDAAATGDKIFELRPQTIPQEGIILPDRNNLPVFEIVSLGFAQLGGIENPQMISTGEKLYITGNYNSGTNTLIFKYNETGNQFVQITGSSPASRKIYNLKAAGKYIFLTGGMNANNGSMTDIWRFDTESEEWTQVPFSLVGDFRKAITQLIDGKLVIANPIIDGNVTHPAFTINNPEAVNVSEIIISYIDIPVTEVEYIEADTYCLNETDNIVKGGLEMSGECMPFTHPWYRSFATGSTIYSVAGKGDRLYVGTNNSIKVYDISDPNALVLKSTFSTGGRIVYDLEVAENDIMYAATSGGIYKLNTANPDTLSSLSFFATSYNYQYRIQLYNDKLYVGDDNGINIRDKETFARLAYVNIDSVLDFAIANGEIALYRSSFWSAGLHIRDVETLNLKAYEYAECYTGELTTDHGAFYLSCDGYEYRFEGRPDTYFNFYPLDGDIREMQENHVYNGWTYIPDGSSVKLSTLNDVPSYCGNGVIEPGELCDGNSVECTTISSSYVSGTAYCNSTCNGYNEGNCSTDGW